MASLTTAQVGLNTQCLAPGPVGDAAADQVLIINLDAKNTVNLGSSSTNLAFPLAAGSSIALSAPVYAAAATVPLVVGIAPGGTSFFLPASLANIGGSKVYVQAGEPAGNIPLNSVWFDLADGSLQTWDGTAWENQAFDAQNLIQAATILGTQIADGTLTTAQLAAAAGILGTQIASATVTSANIAAHTIVAANIAANTITAAEIAANTITAGQIAASTITAAQIQAGAIGTAQLAANAVTAAKIAANTITAGQLAAGIIYAGIINGTTVSAATFTGSVFQGTDFELNSLGAFWYSGTPAAGNLIASIASAAGANDGHGNPFQAGINIYGTAAGLLGMEFFGGGNPAGIRMVPNNAPSSIFSDPGIASFSNNTGTAQYTGAALESGEIASGTGVSTVTAYGGSTDGTTSVPHVQVNGGATGGTLLLDITENGILAGDPASPGSDETWHTGTGLNSFTLAPAGFMRFQYRLYPDNTVGIAGHIENPSAGGPTGTTFFQLPAAYRPNAEVEWALTTAPGSAAVTLGVSVDSSGNMQLRNLSGTLAASSIISVNGRFPLGTV